MSDKSDDGGANGTETTEVRKWTKKQMAVIDAYDFDQGRVNEAVVDALVRSHEDSGIPLEDVAAGNRTSRPSPTPAIEEGPHLRDPEIRAAKRATLREQNADPNDESLTDDMRTILNESDED